MNRRYRNLRARRDSGDERVDTRRNMMLLSVSRRGFEAFAGALGACGSGYVAPRPRWAFCLRPGSRTASGSRSGRSLGGWVAGEPVPVRGGEFGIEAGAAFEFADAGGHGVQMRRSGGEGETTLVT